MNLRNNILLLIFFSLNALSASPKTWRSSASGHWGNNQIWLYGIAPSYTSSDTFIIHHPVIVDSSIVLNSGAYFLIDTTGGICGHYRMTVSTNASVLKYGILELDSLFIAGGVVNCLQPGMVILTLNAYQIITGSSLYVNCQMAVGPWFNCHLPEYHEMSIVEELDLPKVTVFPNPASYELSFRSTGKERSLIISDALGKLIFKKEFVDELIELNTYEYSNGIYFYQVTAKEGNYNTNGKFIISH